MWGAIGGRAAGLALSLVLSVPVSLLAGTGPAPAQPLEGRLKQIQASGTLRIAYRIDSRPFSFLDAQGRPAGYSIELCQRIAQSIERQLGLSALAVTFVQVDTRTRFERIIDGSADMECGSTTVSLSRLESVDFSNLIFAESTGILVKSGRGLISFEDMAGKSIGVIPGSTNEKAVRDQLARRSMQATLVELRDRQQGVAALARGEIDALASDKLVLLALAQAASLRDYTVLSDDLSFEPFAIMLPRGDWAFRLAVNTGLARLFRSGDVVAIYTRHFSGIVQSPSVWLGAVFTFGGLPE
jgi:ABC-type amino acid transport substrate-binding protein